MTEEIIVEYDPRGRATRRARFERLTGGDKYLRHEEVLTERGEWRTVGKEHVEAVRITDPR